jgi:hypothetical protein
VVVNRPSHSVFALAVFLGTFLLVVGLLVALRPPGRHVESTDDPTLWRTTYSASTSEVAARTDPWGIRKIRKTRTGGQAWYSTWADSERDSWITWITTGAMHAVHPDRGVLEVGGDTVRMYVLDPRERQQWTGDLEVTVYARRIPGTGGEPYSGIVTDVRTNHGSTDDLEENPCDSRGLFARLRFDGQADFGKEIRHPRTVSRNAQQVWADGMPAGVWIGYKHIVYDVEGGVAQELWVDFPGDGEQWEMVNRIVDRGGVWGKGEQPCRSGIDPSMPMRGGTDRPGSESGLPNVAVLFRVDDVSQHGGLEYRDASVREVR